MDSAQITLAITGASGAVFGREMLRALEADERVSLPAIVDCNCGLQLCSGDARRRRTVC